ncbi:MAG: hypothetical protein HKL95_09615 [Phycisphaerae bacterium]|nr:hypothetical protein [Phycisphaerae bacterium]
MELRDAISQISEIHAQMAASQVFRGYRSATALFSAAMAVGTAIVQSQFLAHPARHVGLYLLLWIAAAALSLIVIALEMVLRCHRLNSEIQTRLTLLAVESFLPSLIAGAALTYLLFRFEAAAVWLLPPMWMILFSLGILASSRILPRATIYSGSYYLLAGIFSMVSFHGAPMFNPWIMGLVFGMGQLATAGILYYTLERKHEAI